MNAGIRLVAAVGFLAVAVPALSLRAQTPEATTVDAATRVLDEIMAVPAKKIPQSLLADAQGLAIIPNLVKGGFVVGIRHGRGIVVIRDDQNNWKPPFFVSLTGGSVGWQAGLQATDVILVFKTRKSVQGLMQGKFTIGADAAAAAGPVGRQAAAATDTTLGAEILSYSRSRGLFAGVSLDGSALQIDQAANQAYYLGTGYSPVGVPPGQPVQLPPSAFKLLEQLARYTSTPDPLPPASVATAPLAGLPAANPWNGSVEATLRQQLAGAAQQLQALVDGPWKQYLALPASLLTGTPAPTVESVSEAVKRYESVARDPRYAALAQRPEFRLTHELLNKYLSVLQGGVNPALPRPPPPIQTGVQPGAPRL